jgi:dTDP-4-amino-4,6-dideoxygalactose transaminase
LHRQKAFGSSFESLRLPVTESAVSRCFSLPIFPEMTDAQIVQVASVIREALA